MVLLGMEILCGDLKKSELGKYCVDEKMWFLVKVYIQSMVDKD